VINLAVNEGVRPVRAPAFIRLMPEAGPISAPPAKTLHARVAGHARTRTQAKRAADGPVAAGLAHTGRAF